MSSDTYCKAPLYGVSANSIFLLYDTVLRFPFDIVLNWTKSRVAGCT